MSTKTAPNTASESLLPTDRAEQGTIAYRIAVLLLLGACVWFLSRRPQVPAINPALSLLGNTWRHVYEFDKTQHTAEMEFRTDGSITQAGSGQGKFEIISPDEISLDPDSATGGLFGWPGTADRWNVEAVGDNLLVQRRSAPNDRVVLHRVRKPDEQTTQILQALQRIQHELAEQGRARKRTQ